ncbi:MAG: histidine kinase dimerization/phospho-acceptor domain-containing protein, partial [Elusimicrobiota bacterium]
MQFGITKKINLLFISVIIFLAVVLGFYFLQHESRALKIELNERISALLDSLSVNSEYPVLIKDKEAISKLVKTILTQKDIIFCRIEDESGTLLFEAGSRDKKATLEYTCAIIAERCSTEVGEELVLDSGKKVKEEIGKIYLAVSLSSFNQKLSNVRNTIFFVVFVVVGLSVLSTTVLIRHILGNPIEYLLLGTKTIASGNLDYKVSISNKDEIGELATSFNKMTEDLKRARSEVIEAERLATIGKLASVISHELRNPLAVMKTVAYLLKKKVAGDEQCENFLRILNNEIELSNRIISDLLDFAKAKKVTKIPVKIVPLIEEILSSLSLGKTINEQKINIVKNYNFDGEIAIDQQKIKHMLQNLIINAAQSIIDTGTVTI